ncbi:hypothetical protein HOD05_03150 [Candidatus Woesearchaeota archaeon]|jgi:hypothetical protein|nr:hypothetical protein [Candidatus Woesearchaeota archaeon]MBT4151371.1 hypothetical protein [Candidatus Woesearchaeota archaeon]MBT4247769.1 hypothetical protein [Candidatus Woesearchaeota archaeon]MBT4434193.1 hypothetical protein [Candidatus Woesearchaeota archaeon]MBT7332337.1 hypothetical protein [Candidatus Woesearchaeota archaeon]
MDIRKNHDLRLRTYDHLIKLKKQGISRKKIIDLTYDNYKISIGTLYSWYSGNKPYGRKDNVVYVPELFYVLGALLGDGCPYQWKITNNYVILVGDNNFTTKYSNKLASCIKKIDKPYIDRSKNVWFVRSNNYELFTLFKKSRENNDFLKKMINKEKHLSSIFFVEGFFDAEGCVKIIKEKTRKIPKICLDFTNTDFKILEVIKLILKENLGIDARYSEQKSYVGRDGSYRKKCYHLRIYKKNYVKIFLENIHTTKLTNKKATLVKKWIKKIKIKQF